MLVTLKTLFGYVTINSTKYLRPTDQRDLATNMFSANGPK